MKTKLILTMVLGALLAPLAASAQLDPTFAIQGVLRDDTGALVTGSHDLTITIYDVSTEGTALRSEVFAATAVDTGLFAVYMGKGVPAVGAQALDALLLAETELYIGVTIDAEAELVPRILVAVVPFAFQAQHANEADVATDLADPAQYQRPITVGACTGSNALQTFGQTGTPTCVPILDGATGDAPISVSVNAAAGDVNVSLSPCAAVGEALVYNGTDWACAAVIVHPATCVAGQTIKWSAAGVWECQPDDGQVYTGSARVAIGAGNIIDIVGDSIGTGEIGVDGVGASEIAAGAVGTSEIADGSIASVDIADGTVTTTDIANATILPADLANCTAVGNILKYTAVNTWTCAADIDTTYTASARVTITGATNILDLGADSITAAYIATDGVGSAEIAADAVGASEIAVGAVGTSEIADGSVTGTDILDSTIATADILDGTIAVADLSAAAQGNFIQNQTAAKQAASFSINGTMRLGAETVSWPAMPPNMIIRGIYTAGTAAGTVVARTADVQLERDGTNGGLRATRLNTTMVTISCMAITTAGAFVGYNADFSTVGTTAIFTNAQAIGRYSCLIGAPFNGASFMRVDLNRWSTDYIWLGTIESNYNQ